MEGRLEAKQSVLHKVISQQDANYPADYIHMSLDVFYINMIPCLLLIDLSATMVSLWRSHAQMQITY